MSMRVGCLARVLKRFQTTSIHDNMPMKLKEIRQSAIQAANAISKTANASAKKDLNARR